MKNMLVQFESLSLCRTEARSSRNTGEKTMSKTNYDWETIKTEYIANDISLRAIAEKHGISRLTVEKHSKEEGWVKLRKEYRARLGAEIRRKTCNKRAKELADLLEASYMICDRIINALGDPQQFNRYLVTRGTGGGNFETVETVFSKIDTKAIKEMTQALRAVESLIRSIGCIPTEAEMQKLRIEQERFEMEKERWEKDKIGTNAPHGVIVTFNPNDPAGWME